MGSRNKRDRLWVLLERIRQLNKIKHENRKIGKSLTWEEIRHETHNKAYSMSGRQFKCSKCGEYFEPHKDTIELIEEGYISPDNINICEECCGGLDEIFDDFSDADPGL